MWRAGERPPPRDMTDRAEAWAARSAQHPRWAEAWCRPVGPRRSAWPTVDPAGRHPIGGSDCRGPGAGSSLGPWRGEEECRARDPWLQEVGSSGADLEEAADPGGSPAEKGLAKGTWRVPRLKHKVSRSAAGA
ncbi:hypothetical protein NDU88_003827 [Pleurodeles waltl]|uniref:Uncharacterized protein n=1 Tax=Pleurodeles waltl TaxID=8319 RepID=A0AAV7PE89_PLEWA|nr:hypothetical protein NDU88_003827 [Pleurodeles waltl]